MEALSPLSDALLPYKDLVGTIAAVVTIGQMFAGTFICLDIYKQGHTKGITIVPFVGGLVMSGLNLKYGFLVRDDTMIRVNFAGIAINIIYLMVYFNYTREKGQVWAKMGLGWAVMAAILAYAEMEDPSLLEYRFGLIITAFMFYLIASPLFGLNDIIKNKSTEGMPFPIIFSGAIVTCSWLVYGIILKNGFVVVQNVVALVLCTIQLSLFVIYPSKPKAKSKGKSKKAD